ncbi:MAG: nucleotidyltransferase domain-containing protein [Lachnospiraceae bacterium]|nr:nucleotidyltransferase domain-containing protein [Lachnospiraceae bacterium]
MRESQYINLIFFGSYARGDYRADSDIDVTILLDKGKTPVDHG